MKKRRKEEIALVLIGRVIRGKMKGGIKLGPRLYKETKRLAKKTGVPKKQLVGFLKGQMKGVIKSAFKK